MKIQKWEIIYWMGAICAVYGYYLKDSFILFSGLLILLLGTIKGMTRK